MFGISRRDGDETRRSLLGLRDEMDRLFNSLFTGAPLRGSLPTPEPLMPLIDLTETDDEVQLTAELPGLAIEDVQLTMDDNTLRLEGEKKSELETGKGTAHRIERSYGRFLRMIPLPTEVDNDRVTADFKDGVLTVHCPKTSRAKQMAKKISIRT